MPEDASSTSGRVKSSLNACSSHLCRRRVWGAVLVAFVIGVALVRMQCSDWLTPSVAGCWRLWPGNATGSVRRSTTQHSISETTLVATTTGTRTTRSNSVPETVPTTPSSHPAFRSIMTDAERDVLGRTIGAFADAVNAANITYHMCSGTLLGSYRHHGPVPWDDDADVYVPFSDRKRLDAALSRLVPDYVLKKASTRWKLYASAERGSLLIPGWRWRYPFLDISFYVEDRNTGTIHDSDPEYQKSFRFRTSDVFPLTRRPFMGLWLNGPRRTEAVLKQNYDLDVCQTNRYNHKTEKFVSQIFKVKCRELWSTFPFVFRVKVTADGGMVEELRIGGVVKSSVVVRQVGN